MKTIRFLSLGTVLLTMGALNVACSQDNTTIQEPDLTNGTDASAFAENSGNNDYSDAPASTDNDDGWDVIFYDDFTGDSTTPDPDKWVLCEKSTSNWARYLSESYNQAYQKDGYLYLIGEQVNGEYKTGGIETRGKFDFQYGKVECRAKFQTMPKGGHTGIWMMPAPPAEKWPKSGEIDIMEHLNKNDLIYETVHSWYADDMGHKDDPKAQGTVDINKDDWNTYGIIWTPEKITYTVNGEEYLTYPNLHLSGENGAYQWPFDHPFYLILSQSLGGEGTWAGPIDNSELPAVFQIDWIRVSQQSTGHGGSAGVPTITAD